MFTEHLGCRTAISSCYTFFKLINAESTGKQSRLHSLFLLIFRISICSVHMWAPWYIFLWTLEDGRVKSPGFLSLTFIHLQPNMQRVNFYIHDFRRLQMSQMLKVSSHWWRALTCRTVHAAIKQRMFEVSQTLPQSYLHSSQHSLSIFDLVDLVKPSLLRKQLCTKKPKTSGPLEENIKDTFQCITMLEEVFALLQIFSGFVTYINTHSTGTSTRLFGLKSPR